MKFRLLLTISALVLTGCFASKAEIGITNPSFKHENFMPAKFTCDGAGFSPLLKLSGIPGEAQSLALIVDDPDASAGEFAHWVVYNIDPTLNKIPKDRIPRGGVLGVNSAGDQNFFPPCPPPGSGPHRYFYKIYAVDMLLQFEEPPTKETVMDAIKGKILGYGEIMGKYER